MLNLVEVIPDMSADGCGCVYVCVVFECECTLRVCAMCLFEGGN